jgi:hypothetical protein
LIHSVNALMVHHFSVPAQQYVQSSIGFSPPAAGSRHTAVALARQLPHGYESPSVFSDHQLRHFLVPTQIRHLRRRLPLLRITSPSLEYENSRSSAENGGRSVPWRDGLTACDMLRRRDNADLSPRLTPFASDKPEIQTTS